MSRTRQWLLVAGGLFVLFVVGCIGIYAMWIRPYVGAGIPGVTAKTVILDGPSMEPTFKSGERLIFRRYTKGTSPALQRGDIIIYQDLQRPDRLLVKRVIGVAGDQLEMRRGTVYINGAALQEPYAAPGIQQADVAPLTVPSDHVWVLGDNRDASFDSRAVGPIPVAQVQGIWAGR